MKLFNKGLGTVATGVGETVEKVGDAFDKNFTSKEEVLTMQNEDLKSARELSQIAYQQDDKFTKRAIFYLAFYWSIITSIYIFIASFYDFPEKNLQIIYTTVGFLLGTIVGTIITFFFGSSHSSSIKNNQLERLYKKFFNKDKNEEII